MKPARDYYVKTRSLIDEFNYNLSAILGNLTDNLVQNILNLGVSILPVLGDFGNNLLLTSALSVAQLNAAINQITSGLAG